MLIKECGLEIKVETGWAKKMVGESKAKHKELKAPHTGVSTEGEEATAADWKWFGIMDEVMGLRPLEISRRGRRRGNAEQKKGRRRKRERHWREKRERERKEEERRHSQRRE